MKNHAVLTRRITARVVAAVVLGALLPAYGAQPDDAAINKLAVRAGCPLCHEGSPRHFAFNQSRHLAPSWMQVAERYRTDPGAEERLTKTVVAGTGQLLTDQHWRGKVFFSEMPNNDVQLSPDDARAIVHWILMQPR